MNKTISLTTQNNFKALEALNKITPLTISLMRLERSSNIWKIRNGIPATESMDVFVENMQLIEEEMERTANL